MKNIVQHLQLAGNSEEEEEEEEFSEVNISDLVYSILSPILSDFIIHWTGQKEIRMLRKKRSLPLEDPDTGCPVGLE